MKILMGLVQPKSNSSSKTLSTMYQDRHLLKGNLNQRLDRLSKSLNREITQATPYILTLEELVERFHDDCKASWLDGEIGFYMRYHFAFEKSKAIVDYSYSLIPPVEF